MNQQLTNLPNTMSTLDFVKLTGTKHCHVLDKTRKLLKDLGIDSTEFSVEYLDKSGKSNKMLVLDKDLALTLAGQYKPKIAYKVAKSFNDNSVKHQLIEAQQRDEIAAIYEKIEATKQRTEAIRKDTEKSASDHATSATVLLDEWGVDVSVHKFNDLCKAKFLLSRRKPNIVTRKGFQYGTNFNTGISKQPRWYRHTFSELLTHLNIK